MKLLYEIKLGKSPFSIHHQDRLMSMGSCFSEHIAQKFAYTKFSISAQPLGQLYNPISIADALQQLIEKKEYTANDLHFYQEKYHSFTHHSSYSKSTEKETLEVINQEITTFHEQLKNCTVLFITLGSAIAFENKSTNKIVANCHKMPGYHFDQKMLSLDSITTKLKTAIEHLRRLNPTIRLVFTVSPIRYAAFGMTQNSLSKARLLIAIEEITNSIKNTSYFPAYEIMMDELRDYRFYERDLIHPNAVAIDYIWDKLSNYYFDKNTYDLIAKIQQIQQALSHRPFDKSTSEYRQFAESVNKKITVLKASYPYLDTSDWVIKE
jgi:hypothetical protein